MVVGLADSLPQNYEDIEMSKDQPKGEKVTAIVTLKGHTGQEFCQGFTFFPGGEGSIPVWPLKPLKTTNFTLPRSSMPSPLAPDPIRVQSCVCCLNQ